MILRLCTSYLLEPFRKQNGNWSPNVWFVFERRDLQLYITRFNYLQNLYIGILHIIVIKFWLVLSQKNITHRLSVKSGENWCMNYYSYASYLVSIRRTVPKWLTMDKPPYLFGSIFSQTCLQSMSFGYEKFDSILSPCTCFRCQKYVLHNWKNLTCVYIYNLKPCIVDAI
jgi:hypothetical protein